MTVILRRCTLVFIVVALINQTCSIEPTTPCPVHPTPVPIATNPLPPSLQQVLNMIDEKFQLRNTQMNVSGMSMKPKRLFGKPFLLT